MSDSISPYSLDSIFAASPVGSLDKALTNNIRRLNVLQTSPAVLPNQDLQGYLFVTRPQLNMQKENIRNYAPFYGLLNDDPDGAAMAVRSLLDPRIQAGYRFRSGDDSGFRFIEPALCNKIDNRNAFIPFFTNNVITSTGWSDKILPMTSTEPGLHKQTMPMVDGISRNLQEWDLTINLQNTRNDLSIAAMSVWLDYASLVKEGKLTPYFDYLINNRLDYCMRGYRVVVDKNKEVVTKIGACVAGIPSSVPFGMFGDFDRNTPFNEQTKELPFRFRCVAQIWNDPRLVHGFNGSVRCFNPGMSDGNRNQHMKRVPRAYMGYFNDADIYPRIDPRSMRLEWWTFTSTWDQVMVGQEIADYKDMFGTI